MSAVRLGLLALLVSPLGMVLVVVLIERRPFVIKDQYLSYLVGDVLLAAVVAVGAFYRDTNAPLPTWTVVLPAVLGMAYGFWQLHTELDAGVYTLAQGLSPAKLFHQFLVFPVLSVLVLRAALQVWGHWLPSLAVLVLLLGFAGLNLWDQQHPKSPHAGFDWRSFETVDR